MPSLLIKGGRLLSPEDALDGELDLLADGGKVQAIAPRIRASADQVIEAGGQFISPGFIDTHVHLREPGGEISETLETGLLAAVAGGFTSVCPMPNTRPVNDNPALTRHLIERARSLGLARVFPIAAVTLGSEGKSLADFKALVAAGAIGFSDDGKPVRTASLMKEALERTKELDVSIIDHCEVPELSAGGVINEGKFSARLGLKGIPNIAEDRCVERDLEMAEVTGGHLHVAHLTTAGAVALVRDAKRRGVHTTCEVTPHHFTLTDAAVAQYGANAKMNPPLRSADDLEAVLAAIQDGTVDVIVTDHAPHAPELKAKPMAQAPFGVTGLETSFALAMKQLVHSKRISLAQLILLFSSNPARLIHQPLGRIKVGGTADLTLFDPDLEWTYLAKEGFSKSRNSPFDGWEFRGAVTSTIVAGRIVYKRK
ncbi:MAG: dihydroorotase [Acidobacteria bacterium]|nr:dihydroorotase [Acidobacteriota bacterium]